MLQAEIGPIARFGSAPELAAYAGLTPSTRSSGDKTRHGAVGRGRGLDVLALAVQKGFTPVSFIATHCLFMEPLRGHPRFAAILEEARALSEKVRKNV